jgi:hypothetical protein
VVEGVRSPCEGHDAAEANVVTSHVRFKHHHVGDGHRDVPLQGSAIFCTFVACRPLVVAPLDCENGSWWDPVADVCRPSVTQPLACEFGSYWDPVVNVCRTVFVLPPD